MASPCKTHSAPMTNPIRTQQDAHASAEKDAAPEAAYFEPAGKLITHFAFSFKHSFSKVLCIIFRFPAFEDSLRSINLGNLTMRGASFGYMVGLEPLQFILIVFSFIL